MTPNEIYLLNERDYHTISISKTKLGGVRNKYFVECVNPYTGNADVYCRVSRRELQNFHNKLGKLLNKDENESN